MFLFIYPLVSCFKIKMLKKNNEGAQIMLLSKFDDIGRFTLKLQKTKQNWIIKM